ncbi:uncharacterized protein LOC119730513 [Patiria miniata]|uniref:Farnesoic acid O-methyl transferase domain-containing protein n=1 Tax=Patiria miniata TaxID=46514 RepID=A0A914A7K8_PATMI|nr:uncharacterized protein LOC119730513 [Patiria miniata]
MILTASTLTACKDPCECTAIRLGGVDIPDSSYRSEEPRYLDKLIISEDPAVIQTFYTCKECNSTYHLVPYRRKFPFPAFHDAFILDFSVQARNAAMVVLSTDGTKAGNLYQMVLGISGGTAIRRCTECRKLHFVSSPGVLSEQEMRRFWLRYDNGTFALGKHQQAAYFKWTDPAPKAAPLFYGFASWDWPQTWAAHHACH